MNGKPGCGLAGIVAVLIPVAVIAVAMAVISHSPAVQTANSARVAEAQAQAAIAEAQAQADIEQTRAAETERTERARSFELAVLAVVGMARGDNALGYVLILAGGGYAAYRMLRKPKEGSE